ncbi:MAG: hypothetical protein QOJ39_1812, partial [Candidatus Eremiobacteraeota bacterium]|nr:hypothetical protein [Candidatus Eremiobacteraeota bacterium]
GAPVYVSGWLYDRAPSEAPPEIVITVDGAFAAVATTGFARPDVAALHGPAAANCGFQAVVPSGAIAEGPRTFAAVQIVDAMTYRVGPERGITIARSALRTQIATPVVQGVRVHVDRFADDTEPPDTVHGIAAFGASSSIVISGWAADLANVQPSAAVYAVVDGVHLVRARYGSERADVAAALRRPQLRNVGYEIRIDAAVFGPGDHTVSVIALCGDGEGRSPETEAEPFVIRPE